LSRKDKALRLNCKRVIKNIELTVTLIGFRIIFLARKITHIRMTKIGINGFGRIGRLAFRAAVNRKDIEVVGINDLVDPEYMAYMLKYDSTHGKFDGTVEVKDGNLIVNGKKIRVTAEKDPANL
jgi:hypothetical protein